MNEISEKTILNDIINNLALMMRTAQMHNINNTAVINQIERVVLLVNSVLSEAGILRIDLVGEFIHINNERVRYPLEHLFNVDSLIKELKKRGVGTIIFENKLEMEEVKVFVKSFISAGSSDNPFEAIYSAVSGLRSIEIDRLKSVKEQDRDIRKIVKKSYFKAVAFSKGEINVNKVKAKDAVSVKKTKMIIRSLVDMILEEEQLLLGMTAIKDYDEYTYHHSVNVSVLSLALGQRLGFDKKALTELGIAALFHDVGKVTVPPEILNKPASFSDEEWTIIRKHPVWGFKTELKMKTIDPIIIRAAIVSFEHHLNYDYTGYPKLRIAAGLDTFSRIVSIADQYDALTSSRVYRRTALSPDRALSILIEDSGKKVDPFLLKIFVNMVGVFPIGTLVMLNTQELGIVCESNPLFVDRPKVRVIANKNDIRSDYIVDLSEKMPDGRFARSIGKTLDCNKYKINLAEYLFTAPVQTPPQNITISM
ncbi:MAG: HD-GYP domain-containing protein [Nitrospirae bacterium]|nr:HD-GYP domain-containing protein [Nitrospirota bacterium]